MMPETLYNNKVYEWKKSIIQSLEIQIEKYKWGETQISRKHKLMDKAGDWDQD